MTYSNESVDRYFEKAICLIACGKHQNECVIYQNEKAIRQNEKAICLIACGKHQNEKAIRHFE
jgi:hypothetical protein